MEHARAGARRAHRAALRGGSGRRVRAIRPAAARGDAAAAWEQWKLVNARSEVAKGGAELKYLAATAQSHPSLFGLATPTTRRGDPAAPGARLAGAASARRRSPRRSVSPPSRLHTCGRGCKAAQNSAHAHACFAHSCSLRANAPLPTSIQKASTRSLEPSAPTTRTSTPVESSVETSRTLSAPMPRLANVERIRSHSESPGRAMSSTTPPKPALCAWRSRVLACACSCAPGARRHPSCHPAVGARLLQAGRALVGGDGLAGNLGHFRLHLAVDAVRARASARRTRRSRRSRCCCHRIAPRARPRRPTGSRRAGPRQSRPS